jgi:hypothetical protein
MNGTQAIGFFPTQTPPFSRVTYDLPLRPPGRFRRPFFVAPLAPAAQSTIPVRPRQVRDGWHGLGRRPAHWRRAGHLRAFALAPPLGAVGDCRVGRAGPVADGVDQRHGGRAPHPSDRPVRTLAPSCARTRHERGVVRSCQRRVEGMAVPHHAQGRRAGEQPGVVRKCVSPPQRRVFQRRRVDRDPRKRFIPHAAVGPHWRCVSARYLYPHDTDGSWTGLIVSFVIFGQGLSILKGAFWEMTDASASDSVIQSLSRPLNGLLEDPCLSGSLLHVHDLRARRAGSQLFVTVSAGVPGNVAALQLERIEKDMVAALKAERKDVKEVHVHFEVVSEATEQEPIQ